MLYYFSGTGNSLYAARKISERLDNCAIVPIVKTLASNRPVLCERIIVVFPVYMYRAPHIVCRFFKRIKSADQIIAVATMGGESGRALRQVQSILLKNNLDLFSGFEIAMPDNYTPIEGATSPDEQRTALEKADETISDIVKRIHAGERTIEQNTSLFKVSVWPGIFFGYAYIIISKLGRYFRVEQSCNGCGTCEKVCPSATVTLHNGKPRWSNGCEQCFACLQWCPMEAIQYGKKTKGKKRYRNLSVTVQDIIAQK